jgi:hypothetical protein
MEMMRWISVALLLALTSIASAQSPQPQPQPQAAPLVPPGPTTYSRFTLRDGRVVDAYWTGGDPANYYIQTQAGSYWLPRADVVAVVQLAPPPVAPQPAYVPPPVYQPPRDPYFGKAENAPEEPPKDMRSQDRHEGALIFGGFYAITALIALGRVNDDKDAAAGFIPIAGPIIWTMADEDKWLKDGYDWLALLDASCQLIGAFRWIDGATKDAPKKKSAVSIVPVTRHGYGGLAVGGTF